jgi:hypothetical protein
MALVHARAFSAAVFSESPWYAPLLPFAAQLRQEPPFPSADELTAIYRARSAGSDARPLSFVRAEPKKKRKRASGQPIQVADLYEGNIIERNCVPTRENDWHDLFNALVFCAFPRAKWALHARQYRIYAQRLRAPVTRMPGARTREQDALALLDEGGLLVCVAPEQASSIPDDVEALDGALSELVSSGRARALAFGHALYEHLVAGLPPPLAYAHVLVLEPAASADSPTLAQLDAADRALEQALLDPGQFNEPQRARGLSLARLSTCAASTPTPMWQASRASET